MLTARADQLDCQRTVEHEVSAPAVFQLFVSVWPCSKHTSFKLAPIKGECSSIRHSPLVAQWSFCSSRHPFPDCRIVRQTTQCSSRSASRLRASDAARHLHAKPLRNETLLSERGREWHDCRPEFGLRSHVGAVNSGVLLVVLLPATAGVRQQQLSSVLRGDHHLPDLFDSHGFQSFESTRLRERLVGR